VITTAATQSVARTRRWLRPDLDRCGHSGNQAGLVLDFGWDRRLQVRHRQRQSGVQDGPNYETDPHSYQVQVSANDGTNTTAKTITVNLTDVNDNAP